jgi:putative oxidoreductase
MQNSTKQHVFLVFRLLAGAVFLWAGTEKISTPFYFSLAIYNYRLFPGPLIGLAAAILPWVEAIAGLCLLAGLKTKGAAAITSLLLLVFVGLIIISAIRGLDIDCGCFGGVERKVGLQAILEDTALLVVSITVLLLERNPFSVRVLFRGTLPGRIEK